MSAVSRLRSWWNAIARRGALETQMEAELRFHIEAYAQDLMGSGMKWEDALRRARMELGGVSAQKEQCRSSLGVGLWDEIVADARYAFRQLRQAPVFTFTVLVVLTLGIGANAAMFSIVDATLLRWLPYHRSNQLVSIYLADARGNPTWGFYQDIEEWQKQAHGIESLAYYAPVDGYLQTNAGGQSLSAYKVSANVFDVLGVRPARGRAFVAGDQVAGNSNVVILSDPVWHAMLQADPNAVGKQVTLNDKPYTVVGIMPPRFVFPANKKEPQLWIPAELTPAHLQQIRGFDTPNYQVIARLRPGVSNASVSTALSGVEARLVPLYPPELRASRPLTRVDATPYRDTLVKDSRPALLALIAAVAIMWLIACANVAHLMLARGMARQREIAVRGALGASRWRIVRQLFTESLLLSVLGSVAGLGLAQVALAISSQTLKTRLNLPDHPAPNAGVLGALLVLTISSAILFGLLPSWLAARLPIEQSLRQGSVQAGASRSRHRLQQTMVVAEIGLSLVLLVACGLMLRTVFALRKVPLGFRTDHVLMVQPRLPRFKYRNVDANRTVYQPLLRRIQRLPGVKSAAITTVVPLRKGFAPIIQLAFTNKKSAVPILQIDAQLKAAGPELQDVLGFRMARGRFFNAQDTPDSQPVVVVNQAFAQKYLSGDVEKPSFRLGKGRTAKIIGVIDDFHQASIDRPAFPEIDLCAPQLQFTDGFYQPTLQAHVEIAIRSLRDPRDLIPSLRRAMLELNPDLQAGDIETMDQIVEDSMGSQLLAAHLLELFAGVALLIALTGLYGLLTYFVAQRNHELGVRLALGAQRKDIVEMLLSQAGRMLLAGAAIGVTLAYISTRMVAGFLYGVASHDPATMIGVTALLLACGLLAAFVPARSASRIDPLEALRRE
ncbi:MAG: ADOP family duplicated permease [Actinomycetota bacterium]